MKQVFVLFCLLCATTLCAQSIKKSISLTTTDTEVSFSVKLDRSHSELLSDAYLKLMAFTGKPSGVAKIEGTSEMETANGTRVLLNTKRASLKVLSAEGNTSSIAEAKRYVTFLRQELNLGSSPTPPAPPAPPRIH